MSAGMGLYKVALSGPVVPTDKAFNFNCRFTRLCSVGHLNAFSFGNAAESRHFNGPAPEVTRYSDNVLGSMKLRGPNMSGIVDRRLPGLGRYFSGGIVTGIDNFSISSCTCAYRGLSDRSRVN